jgi:hypothetical protein
MAEYVRCAAGTCSLPLLKEVTEGGVKVKVRQFEKRDCSGVTTPAGQKPECLCFILATRQVQDGRKKKTEELFYEKLSEKTEKELKNEADPKYTIKAACLKVNELGQPKEQ